MTGFCVHATRRTRSSAAAVGTALCVALFVQPVAAQETGTLINRPTAQIRGFSANDSRLAMDEFGVCVVRRWPARATRALAIPVDDPRYHQLMEDMAIDECLSSGTLSFAMMSMRGSLYEALYEVNYARHGRIDFTGIAHPDYLAGYAQPLSAEATAVIAIARFGECVARTDSQSAVSLMTSPIGSAGEVRLMTALTPALSACIPAGQTLRLSRTVVRGAVAEGLVRMLQLADAAAEPQR